MVSAGPRRSRRACEAGASIKRGTSPTVIVMIIGKPSRGFRTSGGKAAPKILLKQLELNRQILLWVLAKVVHQLHAFRREVVDVCVELIVGDQFAERSFAALGAGHHAINPRGGRVEAS